MNNVTVVGAGLAGCEAAWQLARRGVNVALIEMKPLRRSPAHHLDDFCELVCSNSLKADRTESASGLLKAELRLLDSLVLRCAERTRVEAGGALAVDREAFSRLVTREIVNHPRIKVEAREVTEIPPEGPCVIATGPLTDEPLAADIATKTGAPLFFFDAAAPLVSADSLDWECCYEASRYGRGTPDYANCPMDADTYRAFRAALAEAEEAPVRDFEDKRIFEGCMPIEVMARRGEDTLRYGPLKPVGLRDPRTGQGAYAVLQLRRDNAAGSVYNLVGCQTHLTFGEQKRVFSLVPALKNAEFLRFGVMHRNSYLDSPRCLNADFSLRSDPRVHFAGQMTGVEGYVESCASGAMAGIALARKLLGQTSAVFPPETMLGALSAYIANPAVTALQPMNANFGILPPLVNPSRHKKEKYAALAARALETLQTLVMERWEEFSL